MKNDVQFRLETMLIDLICQGKGQIEFIDPENFTGFVKKLSRKNGTTVSRVHILRFTFKKNYLTVSVWDDFSFTPVKLFNQPSGMDKFMGIDKFNLFEYQRIKFDFTKSIAIWSDKIGPCYNLIMRRYLVALAKVKAFETLAFESEILELTKDLK